MDILAESAAILVIVAGVFLLVAMFSKVRIVCPHGTPDCNGSCEACEADRSL